MDYSKIMAVLGFDDWAECEQYASSLNTSIEIVDAICWLNHVSNMKDFMSVWEVPTGVQITSVENYIKNQFDKTQDYFWGTEPIKL